MGRVAHPKRLCRAANKQRGRTAVTIFRFRKEATAPPARARPTWRKALLPAIALSVARTAAYALGHGAARTGATHVAQGPSPGYRAERGGRLRSPCGPGARRRDNNPAELGQWHLPRQQRRRRLLKQLQRAQLPELGTRRLVVGAA